MRVFAIILLRNKSEKSLIEEPMIVPVRRKAKVVKRKRSKGKGKRVQFSNKEFKRVETEE